MKPNIIRIIRFKNESRYFGGLSAVNKSNNKGIMLECFQKQHNH